MPRTQSFARSLGLVVVLAVPALVPGHAVAPQAQATTGIQLVHLETEAASEPLGLDNRSPRFSWALASEGRGVLQASCRVLVASRPDLAWEGSADIWDSGVITSSDPWVVYGGPALAPRTRYFWTVRVSSAHGSSGPAAPTWFETGKFEASEWQGQWIAGPERPGPLSENQGSADDAAIRRAGEFCRPVGWLTTGWSAAAKKNNQGDCRELRPAPMLRRSFTIRRPVARARLYASGLAYADVTMNGRPVADTRLDPGFTDYSRTVLYTTVDVTALLQQGENILAATLGSGQFDNAARTWDWGWEDAQWRATPRLRADLHVTYGDGSEDVIASDGSWKASADGPTRYDNFYLGETHDARRETAGWTEPGFSDAGWGAARVVQAPTGVMRAERHEPIRIVSRREPGTRREPVPGVIVYDIGQNLTGWVEISTAAPAGTAIEIFYSEKLAKDGTASTDGNALV